MPEHILQEEAQASIISWFPRMPSKSNIPDDPSRGHTTEATEPKKNSDALRTLSVRRERLSGSMQKQKGMLRHRASPFMSQKKMRTSGPNGRWEQK